jgi:protein-disulfide isomerase
MNSRMIMVALVVIGAAFGAGGMWLAARVAPGDLTTANRAQVERVVREYVLANPELIPQAMQKLQERDTGKAVAASRGKIEQPYAGAWIGNPDADVTLVEYFDYNCSYCRASLPTIERLVAGDKNLRVVFRELPVLAESSRNAARASLAAAEQGKYKAFHDALYAAGPVTDATIAATARSTGVSIARLPDDADTEIAKNLSVAATLGITGTPSWVVGDRVLSGAVPIEQLQDAITAARAKS